MMNMFKPKIIILALLIVIAVPFLFKPSQKAVPAYVNHNQTQSIPQDNPAPAFKNKIQATKS